MKFGTFTRLPKILLALVTFWIASTSAMDKNCSPLLQPLARRDVLRRFGLTSMGLWALRDSALAAATKETPVMTPLVQLDGAAAVFMNSSAPQQFIAFENSAILQITPHGTIAKALNFVDPRCTPDKLKHAVFVDSYFIGLKGLCLWSGGRVDFVASHQPSPDAFSIHYLNHDDKFINALINGRPFESTGYIQNRRIDRKNQTILDSPLIEDVPGYSGGMWIDTTTIYLAIASDQMTHEIYALDRSRVEHLITTGQTAKFKDVAKRLTGSISGLSLALFAQEQEFLLFNNIYGTYTVSRSSELKINIDLPTNCTIVGPWDQHQWLALCDSKNLQLMETSRLAR
jgi:hypothetical protein